MFAPLNRTTAVAVSMALSLLVLTGCGGTQPTNESLQKMQQPPTQGNVTLRLSSEDRPVVDRLHLNETAFVWSSSEQKREQIADAVCLIDPVSAADYNIAIEAFSRYGSNTSSPERLFNDSATALESLVAKSMQRNCGR